MIPTLLHHLPMLFHIGAHHATHPQVWMTLHCNGSAHSGGIVPSGPWAGWWYGPGGACTTNTVM